jgi:hypothetical protein
MPVVVFSPLSCIALFRDISAMLFFNLPQRLVRWSRSLYLRVNDVTPTVLVHAVRYLLGKGLPLNGAVAVAVVLYCESMLNTGSQGVQSTEHGGVLNPDGAYGIASWNGPRQARLQAFCERQGIDVTLLEAQLYFVLNECANFYPKSWAAIRSDQSANDIIITFVADYETPKDIPAEVARAQALTVPLMTSLAAAKTEAQASSPPAPDPVVSPRAPTMPPALPLTENDTMPFAALLQLAAPLLETVITSVLSAHGIKNPGATPAPAPAPAPTAIDTTALAALIAKELTALGINVKA